MPRTLLLADDSPTIHRVVELTFAGEDMRVLTAEDGEEAIALLKTDRPDIVLADIGMPKKTGYEVAEFIKHTPALAGIPVLLLAGAFDPVDEDRVEQCGCNGVLVKPFEPRHVIERVRELLGGTPGSPTTAASAVPRPVERLAPPLDLAGLDIPPTRPLRLISTPSRGEDEFQSADTRTRDDLAQARGMSLDDYFEQLDAAFAVRSAGSEPPRMAEPKAFDAVPTPPPPERWEQVADAPDFDVFDLPPLGETPADAPRLPNGEAHDTVLVPFATPADGLDGPAWEPDDAFAFERDALAAAPRASGARAVPAADDRPAEMSPPAATTVPLPTDLPALAEVVLADEAFRAEVASRVAARLGPAALDAAVRAVVTEAARDAVARLVTDTVAETAERLIREELERLTSKMPTP